MQGARSRPWWAPRASRATPQTPLAEPTLRERTDLPSFVVVASSLGSNPTSSAPPRLKANPSRSRPRGILRQAPSIVESRIVARQPLLRALARSHQRTRDAFEKSQFQGPPPIIVELLRGNDPLHF